MIQISVVIPTHNRAKLLTGCLQSLINQTLSKNNFEIIIADDYSQDETPTIIKQYQAVFPNIKYYRKIIPSGSYINRNIGFRHARGKIIAFLDDDCQPDKNWLKNILAAFQKNPSAQGIEGETTTSGIGITPFTEQIINLAGGAYQTCNIAYRKKVLQAVGGFDEWYQVHCGDVDLALRVLEKGPIIFCPKVIVCHPPRPTDFWQQVIKTYFIRSEIYFFLKRPKYFQKLYPKRNVFWQVVFVNSIWQRLFLIKFHIFWLKKKPWLYAKYAVQRLLEIAAILLQLPKFWLVYRKYR